MPESHDDLTDVTGYDDVLARVAGASSGISAHPGAGAAVRGALGRRRRRRAIAGSAGAVVAVAAVAGTLFVATDLAQRDDTTPAAQPTSTGAVGAGLFRPAGFFEDLAGGVAVPRITRNHPDKHVVLTTRFTWASDAAPDDLYLAALAIEGYRRSADAACAALAGGQVECETQDDGTVVGRYVVPADGAFIAPVRRVAPLRFDGSDAAMRGVTYFGADGRAISVTLCNCSEEGDVLADEAPVSDETLVAFVTDGSWAKDD